MRFQPSLLTCDSARGQAARSWSGVCEPEGERRSLLQLAAAARWWRGGRILRLGRDDGLLHFANPQRELAGGVQVDGDGGAGSRCAAQKEIGERVLDLVLNQAAKWAGPVCRVIAVMSKFGLGRLCDREGE